MKILLVVASYLADSYLDQADALEKGFTLLGISNELYKANNPSDLSIKLKNYCPDVVIGVGNWTEYELFVNTPKSMGITAIPWIVVDEDVIDKHIDEYNQHQVIITPSQRCKNSFIKSGIDEKFITVIPEAVDPNLWYPLEEKKVIDVLADLTIPVLDSVYPNQRDMLGAHQQHIPIIYTVGGDATKKGAQEVIQALGRLDKNIPWIYMIKSWPGPTVFQKSCEELELAQKVGIFDRIKYISAGYSQSYMNVLMNICDIYAAPSRIEGFGLPHVEAQMCGKPVISLSTTATQETVVHGQTGFHAKRDFSETNFVKADIDDLSQCLKTLITDTKLRHQMGENAIKHANTNFSPKIIAQKFVDLIAKS